VAPGGDLAPRLLTLLVLIPALLAVMFADPTMWGVLALAVVAGVLALDELLRMTLGAEAQAQRVLRVAVGGLGAAVIAAPVIALQLGIDPRLPIQTDLLTAAVLAIGLIVLVQPERAAAAKRFTAALAGLLYVALPMSALARIKAERTERGAVWLLVVIAIPFVADATAYIAGRLVGRHKIYPAISPGKTWEGAAGGVAGSIGAVLAIRAIGLADQLAPHHAVAVAALAGIAGQCGDFVESALKRAAGVKDSGRLLPGHGGMLDRIDALLFAGPVAYYYLVFVAPARSMGPP
jgi:phosphatidate cytidylyltransferase